MIDCKRSVSFFLIFWAYAQAAPFPGGCTLNTNKDLPKKNEPILLIKGGSASYRLAMPETKGKEGFIQLKSGQELIMACPGQRNFLNETKQVINLAVCKSGHLLIIDEREFQSELLDCSGRAAANIKKTDKKCHQGKGTELEIGFKSQGWHPLVTICHDINGAHTFYSTHTLYGSVLRGKVYRSTGRPNFSRGEKFLFQGFSPDRSYNRNNQKRVIQEIVGENKLDEFIDEKKVKFMARGHLSPDADFLFSSWQLLTYFYINVAPQWQSINAGNWLNVETNTRKLAAKLGADIEVATGTHGICKIVDDKGKSKNLYLEGKTRLPVPEYYWKVLRNPKDNSCIGFVTTNNPFLKSSPKHKCTDICAKHKWPVMQNDLFKGYVYCCDYESIKKAMPEVPDLKCTKILANKQ